MSHDSKPVNSRKGRQAGPRARAHASIPATDAAADAAGGAIGVELYTSKVNLLPHKGETMYERLPLSPYPYLGPNPPCSAAFCWHPFCSRCHSSKAILLQVPFLHSPPTEGAIPAPCHLPKVPFLHNKGFEPMWCSSCCSTICFPGPVPRADLCQGAALPSSTLPLRVL